MFMETGGEMGSNAGAAQIPEAQRVLHAESPAGTTYGVVSSAEPSSLTLLAAGVAGMAARRARRRERVREWQAQNPQT